MRSCPAVTDTLLKLSPTLQADLILARYTCIALQRVGGSAKKVKGSLEDKTTRLPMSHPIFSRLEEMIKTPASSLQWSVLICFPAGRLSSLTQLCRRRLAGSAWPSRRSTPSTSSASSPMSSRARS
jgi:hypothetical protein